ncbi:cation-transporting P-type ATPase [Nonomuraea sp. NPDC048881]|uniref:cation-transporting P-type ATPase n=1 Tax=unclassified Nonomuraea TaxID=2593643 RepID=UPI0033DEF985
MVWAPDAPTTPGSGPAPLSQLQTLRLLDTGPRGLTEEQAEARLLEHGENTIPAQRPVSCCLWLVLVAVLYGGALAVLNRRRRL